MDISSNAVIPVVLCVAVICAFGSSPFEIDIVCAAVKSCVADYLFHVIAFPFFEMSILYHLHR